MTLNFLIVGPLQANCYILADEKSREAAVIDPGGDGERIRAMLEEEKVNPVVFLNTHGHIDHIAANKFLKELYQVPLMIHAEDAPLLTDPTLNLSFPGVNMVDSPPADRQLHDGDEVSVGGMELEVIHTPGHSPGSVCFFLPRSGDSAIVFTGDTLFAGGVGRTDFAGGSMPRLIDSIQTKLLVLPDETIIYPGHGPHSTIGNEKRTNPFLI